MLVGKLADVVAGLAGWRRAVALVAAGVVSVLAMAPFHVWPVLALTLPMLVWSLDAVRVDHDATPRRRAWRAFLTGWWLGFGYFVAGLFWVGEAFLVEAEVFAVLLPFAVTLLPAGLAIFWGAAAATAMTFWRAWPGPERVIILAVALTVAEWLRGHLLTGLPWNIVGYALTWPLPLMQSAALIGIYGLTLVAIVMLAAPLVWLGDVRAARLGAGWRIAAALVVAVPLAALLAFGSFRLAGPEPPSTGIKVRVVQPSVPQREKWRPENQRRIFEQHLELSHRDPAGRQDGAAGIGLIVWPEAAMPFRPLEIPEALAAIGRMLPEGSHLAAGAIRLERPSGPAGERRVWNSLMFFGAGGKALAVYDKIHLVPFGEYLPFQPLLESIGLEQLTRMRGGFATGVTPRPLVHVPGLPAIGPLVCYEAIFPAAIVQGRERPGLLVNVTNDGWFGNTTGPRQHLHQSRVRAVEEGLPLVRSANNGISAIIDGKGREIARLELDAIGTIDAVLQPALAPPLYARWGDLPFWLMIAVTVVIVAAMRLRFSAGHPT
jgi:apolipoprotein N-acyltransferase